MRTEKSPTLIAWSAYSRWLRSRPSLPLAGLGLGGGTVIFLRADWGTSVFVGMQLSRRVHWRSYDAIRARSWAAGKRARKSRCQDAINAPCAAAPSRHQAPLRPSAVRDTIQQNC